jgi:predicted AAA+ superfamily ATPase
VKRKGAAVLRLGALLSVAAAGWFLAAGAAWLLRPPPLALLPHAANASIHELPAGEGEPWTILVLSDIQHGFGYLDTLFREGDRFGARAILMIGDVSSHGSRHLRLPAREMLRQLPAERNEIRSNSDSVLTKSESSLILTGVIERRIAAAIRADLGRKMVLLSGPRQCGKSTLVQAITREQGGQYLCWDVPADRRVIQRGELDRDAPLWTFDELHKHRRWRAVLKGLWDSEREGHRILVTGSARLELYGHGGDSLQGRYFAHHLHPFTASELARKSLPGLDAVPELPNDAVASDLLASLLALGGFPEPFLSGSAREAARWRLGYADRLVREDVRELERVRELDRIELLYDRLGAVAGGLLSINSLREELEVAFETVRSWIAILERLDAVFRIAPYGPPRIRSVKKEQKLYFWDWMRAESAAARFENLLALHLLRLVHWARDVEGEKLDLRYFRTRMGHEVDFVLLRGGKAWIAIEAKLAEQPLAPGLRYLLERVPIPHAFQVHARGGRERRAADVGRTRVRHVSAARLLASLP